MDLREVGHCLVSRITGTVSYSESMKKHTTWRIGGPADLMVVPAGISDIKVCTELAHNEGIPVTVIGNGSNLLVSDNGIRGIVLKISHGFNKLQITDTSLKAQAGALVPLASKLAAEEGLTGLEFAAGIPASVGGALCMNAGAHGKCMSDVVREVTVLGLDGQILSLCNSEIGFEYRKSSLKDKGLIVLGAEFDLARGEPGQIKAACQENLAKRRKSQPLEFPNAGSVFANPPGQWAGWLIEQVGGKGMRIGGAMVSEKHANFIVNTGEATASDVLSLIDRIKQLVLGKFNIELTLEVRVLGE